MSKFGYCKVGRMDGIMTTTKELIKYAHKRCYGAIDEYIPIPEGADFRNHDCEKAYRRYWECQDTGKHGWCCATCGKVTQWG